MPVQTARQTFYLPIKDGQRLCVFYPPVGPCRGRVLYVAPLAEEMNKARRMAALQARALADAGFAVLQPDLLGCGDSSGDFSDATWDAWLEDLGHAHNWLSSQVSAPDWLWGLRAGCLLAGELGERLHAAVNYLFWQPPASGKTVLQQFLRLKLAGDVLEGSARQGMDAIRNRLDAGQPVEVAGYLLSPGLARGLEASQLKPPRLSGRLAWLELSTREGAALSPVGVKLVDQWREAGHRVTAEIVRGPAFWQTTEIEDAPALLDASLRVLCEGVPA